MKDFDINKWETRRKWTTLVFAVESFLLGCEYTITLNTLWLYLKEITDTPQIFYSLVAAAYMTSMITASFFVSPFMDRWRRNRLAFFVCNVFIIVGNLMYSVRYSPYFLIAGRAISGCGGPLRSVINAEVARVYVGDNYMRIVSYIALSYSLGFMIAPMFNFVFFKVNFTVCGMKVNYLNGVGIYMALFFAVIQLVSFFALSDLSKEYDLKGVTNDEDHKQLLGKDAEYGGLESSEEMNPLLNNINYTNCSENDVPTHSQKENSDKLAQETKYRMGTVILALASSVDIGFIMLASFFTFYLSCKCDMWIPVVAMDVNHYTVAQMNLLLIGVGVTAIFFLLLFISREPGGRAVYKLAVVALIAYIVMETGYMLLYLFQRNAVVVFATWIVLIVCFGYVTLTEEIFFVSCLAQLVPTEIQNTADTIRLSFERTGSMLALLSGTWFLDYVYRFEGAFICMLIVSLLVMFWRRKVLQTPQVIIKLKE